MAGLVRGSLEKAYGGQVIDRNSIPEVGKGILMVCLIRVPDGADGRWRHVVRIRRRCIVLEWVIVIVILAGALRHAASGSGGRKVTIEPAPGNALCVQEITH